jgi:hypothetical protein
MDRPVRPGFGAAGKAMREALGEITESRVGWEAEMAKKSRKHDAAFGGGEPAAMAGGFGRRFSGRSR